MNAIILAAGKGERLHPLTENKPKCLVELFGKSLLQWQINAFHEFGIDDITVVSGYKSEEIHSPYVTILKNEKFDSTNMVESLLKRLIAFETISSKSKVFDFFWNFSYST